LRLNGGSLSYSRFSHSQAFRSASPNLKVKVKSGTNRTKPFSLSMFLVFSFRSEVIWDALGNLSLLLLSRRCWLVKP